MENIKSLNSENIRIFTTEEVIQNQVKNLIHELKDAGNGSHNRGCPYAEKDEAKDLGARWDPEDRIWFVPDDADKTHFKKWWPKEVAADPSTLPG